MKREKERERERKGEITDTADTSKHSEETQQRRAAQHRQIAEELDMLWDYTGGLIRAAVFLKFHSSTFYFSAVLIICNNSTTEDNYS